MMHRLSVLLDCTTNAVMNVEAVKRFAAAVHTMGYQSLLLCADYTVAPENTPYFGYLRGQYTRDELTEMVRFCDGIGMELIPCLSAESSLSAILPGLTEIFTSKNVHVGAARARLAATECFDDRFGPQDRPAQINESLANISETVRKYGMEATVWLDVFGRYERGKERMISEEDFNSTVSRVMVPDNINLVLWDGDRTDAGRDECLMHQYIRFGRPVYYSVDARCDKGFVPDNRYATERGIPALTACSAAGSAGTIITTWLGDGGECSRFAVLPTLSSLAEAARGNTDPAVTAVRFREQTGCDIDSFLYADALNAADKPNQPSVSTTNSAKYFFYNDLLLGMNDYRAHAEDEIHAAAVAEKLRGVERGTAYDRVFDFYAALAEVLARKTNLGNRLRDAYRSGNKDVLRQTATDADLLPALCESFYTAYRALWCWENKANGFNIQEYRIGGMILRVEHCIARVWQYLNGELTSLPELDEPVLHGNQETTSWMTIVSANIV